MTSYLPSSATLRRKLDVEDVLAIATGAVLAGVGIYVALSAPGQGIWGGKGPGSGFLTLVVGVGLLLLGCTYLAQRIRALVGKGSAGAGSQPDDRMRHEDATESAIGAVAGTAAIETVEVKPEPHPADKRSAKPFAIVASLLVLASVIDLLGFQLSMLAFLMFHLRILGKQGWIVSICISLAGAFGIFALFTRVFRVALPASSLDFLNAMGL